MSTLPCPFSLYFFILPPFSCFFYNTYKFPERKKYRIRPVWLNPVFFYFTLKTPSGLFYSDFQSFVYTILCIYPYCAGSFACCSDKAIRGNGGYFCIAAFVAEFSVAFDLLIFLYFFCFYLCGFPIFRVIFETFFLFPIWVTETAFAFPYLPPPVTACTDMDVSVTTFLPFTSL